MNYHLFIVDELSLKYHLEYGFVGTGRASNEFSIGLYKDLCRLKNNDKIIFYVQGTKKFYGIYQVVGKPFYESAESAYLQPIPLNILNSKNVEITLRYRCLIEPFEVYQYGINEFDLVDILPNNTVDVLWSVLYRKLKGARGNSPLFEREFNIIRNKINLINNDRTIDGISFTFENNQILQNSLNRYMGTTTDSISLNKFFLENEYSEDHIHALMLKHTPSIIFSNQIDWIGNEVSCGAGMQSMDILFINNNIFNILEIKKGKIPLNIGEQVSKYIYWLNNRFNNHNIKCFQPIILGEKININTKSNSIMITRRNKIIEFNNLAISLPIKYYEYEITEEDILIHLIDYSYNEEKTFINQSSFSIVNNDYIGE